MLDGEAVRLEGRQVVAALEHPVALVLGRLCGGMQTIRAPRRSWCTDMSVAVCNCPDSVLSAASRSMRKNERLGRWHPSSLRWGGRLGRYPGKALRLSGWLRAAAAGGPAPPLACVLLLLPLLAAVDAWVCTIRQ